MGIKSANVTMYFAQCDNCDVPWEGDDIPSAADALHAARKDGWVGDMECIDCPECWSIRCAAVEPVKLWHTNRLGERSLRTLVAKAVKWSDGCKKWPKPQYLMQVYDVDKQSRCWLSPSGFEGDGWREQLMNQLFMSSEGR